MTSIFGGKDREFFKLFKVCDANFSAKVHYQICSRLQDIKHKHIQGKSKKYMIMFTRERILYTEGGDLEWHNCSPWQLNRNILRVLISLWEVDFDT